MRCEVCWMTCVFFRVSVSVLRSPSSSPEPFPFTELFHRDYSALFIIFVSQPRSPQPFSFPVHLPNRIVTLSPLRTLM